MTENDDLKARAKAEAWERVKLASIVGLACAFADLKARAKAKAWERVKSACIVGLSCALAVAVPLALGVEVNVVVTILASVALLAFSYELGVRPVEKPKRRKSLAQLETEREIERCEWEAALSADSNQPDRVAFYRSRADGQRRLLDEMKRSERSEERE